VGVSITLAALLAMGGIAGCGEAGKSGGGTPMAKADVVDVTYYYLPG
jgi:hypothetical protein